MSNYKDISGKKSGRLTAVEFVEMRQRPSGRYSVWRCRCDCGNMHVISSRSFGKTKSCGCLKRETTSRIMTTHGMTAASASREDRLAYLREYEKTRTAQSTKSSYKWREENRERYETSVKKYRADNREKLSKYRSEHRKKNPEHHNKVRKLWYQKNKGRSNAWCARRRALTNKVVCKNAKAVEAFYKDAKHRKSFTCAYCEKVFTEQPDVDHIIPLSRGGPHDVENLCLACERCNTSKKDKLLSEWRKEGQQLLSL